MEQAPGAFKTHDGATHTHTYIYIYYTYYTLCIYIICIQYTPIYSIVSLSAYYTYGSSYVHTFQSQEQYFTEVSGEKNHNCERQTRTQFKKCMFMQLKVVDGKKQHEREHLRANDWSTASIPNIYKMETRRNLRQRNSSPLSLDSTSWSLNFIPKAISNIQDYKDIDCSTMEQMVLDYILNLKRLKY